MTAPVAIVTGAARGLGLAVARGLADLGYDLFLVDMLVKELEQVQQTFRQEGRGCEIAAIDISKRDACFAAVDAATKAFGRLDALINVAGIVSLMPTVLMSEVEYNRIMAVNAGGTFFFCQAALPHLLETNGSIVNVASQAGVTGSAYVVAYSASKAAVIQMTKSLAVEYRDAPIRINVVCPGGMATPMGEGPSRTDVDYAKIERFLTPRGLLQPEEVAALIVFVASPAGSAIHGAVLVADNGVSAG